MTIGGQIKQKREEKQLSQEELAEQIGVSRQAVSKWEGDLSVPTGANRRALCQILSLDLPESEGPSHRRGTRWVAGWLLAAALCTALLCSLVQISRLQQALDGASAREAPAILSIRFYNRLQEEVLPEALWYNAAEIESILIQWTGDVSPDTVSMFFTPSGSETIEQMELLSVKAPADGEHALLLSATPLHQAQLMGHLHFELHFGGNHTLVTDELYHVFFDPELLA